MAREDGPGVVTLRGDGNIDQLLRRAITTIEALGLDVHAVIDHSGDAAEAGVTMPETKLVLFGSSTELAELMVVHPRLAIELPFKLLLCDTDERQVSISYLAPDDLALRYALTDEEADVLRVVGTIARRARGDP